MIEIVLVAPFLCDTRGTCVPIFNIKSTAVADILVCEHFQDVGKMNLLSLLRRLNPSRY
jgi:hypothetical protein